MIVQTFFDLFLRRGKIERYVYVDSIRSLIESTETHEIETTTFFMNRTAFFASIKTILI